MLQYEGKVDSYGSPEYKIESNQNVNTHLMYLQCWASLGCVCCVNIFSLEILLVLN